MTAGTYVFPNRAGASTCLRRIAAQVMKADLVEAEGLQAEGGRQRLSLLTSPLSRPSSQEDQEWPVGVRPFKGRQRPWRCWRQRRALACSNHEDTGVVKRRSIFILLLLFLLLLPFCSVGAENFFNVSFVDARRAKCLPQHGQDVRRGRALGSPARAWLEVRKLAPTGVRPVAGVFAVDTGVGPPLGVRVDAGRTS